MARFSAIAIAVLSAAIASANEVEQEDLTFFDQDFAARGSKGDKKPAANNTELYSHNVIGFATQNQVETSGPTIAPTTFTNSPTPPTEHWLHGTALPDRCAWQITNFAAKAAKEQPNDNSITLEEELSGRCRKWLAKNPEFEMPSMSPSMSPSAGPSPGFEVTSEVGSVVTAEAAAAAGLDSAEEDGVGGGSDGDGEEVLMVENVGSGTSDSIGNSTEDSIIGDSSFSEEISDSPTNNTSDSIGDSTTTATSTATVTKTVTLSYQLAPMDDTFLEVWRSNVPLGSKTKLKIDADYEGVPTKVIQLKFGLGGVFGQLHDLSVLAHDEDGGNGSSGSSKAEELLNATQLQNIHLELTTATLQMYAMTPSSYGGAVSRFDSVDWNEESAVWNDYAKGGKNGMAGEEFLPSETLSEFGAVAEGSWYDADVTGAVEGLFQSSIEQQQQLALRISTDSSDGVIYASKEGPNGPILALEFVLTGTLAPAAVESESDEVELMEADISPTVASVATVESDGVEVAAADILDTVQPTEVIAEVVETPTISSEVPIVEEGANNTVLTTEASLEEGADDTVVPTEDTVQPTEAMAEAVETPTISSDVPIPEDGANNTVLATETSLEEGAETTVLATEASLEEGPVNTVLATTTVTEEAVAEAIIVTSSLTVSPSRFPILSPVEAAGTESTTSATEEALAEAAAEAIIITGSPTVSSGFSTLSPVEPTPILVRPFKEPTGEKTPITAGNSGGNVLEGTQDLSVAEDNEASETNTNEEEEASINTSEISTNEEEEVSISTSVISSAFKMTITAIKTIQSRNLQNNLRINRHLSEEEKSDISSHPSINEKELPAITQQLERVYSEVLSIAPASISLVFVEDLVVEGMKSRQNIEGVIRKSVFRVMAKFDDPGVSTIRSDKAVEVLDQATIYAFVGPEENQFIQVLKSTGGEKIMEGPAEYDVTVLKVDYFMGSGGADDGLLQEASASSSANTGDVVNDASNGQSITRSSASSSSSWLEPTLIAGASLLVFASSAAALLLWKQRHRSLGGEEHHQDIKKTESGDPFSPRSQETGPMTPSPTVFMERFKNKKKFDYAEFGDSDENIDGDFADQPDPSSRLVIDSEYHGDGAISPLSTEKALSASNMRRTKPNSVLNRSQPMAQDIKFSPYENVSFDDSSVSDVSAHVMGTKNYSSALKNTDAATIADLNASQAESFLLSTTMESYNMDAMSALDEVRLDNVLQLDDPSPPPYHSKNATVGGIVSNSNHVTVRNMEEVVRHEADDGSLSIGAVPSELYSNLSMDSYSNNISHDTSAVYGDHLFTSLDMMVMRNNRNKDSSLLELPPPPSDAASESSSRKDPQDDLSDELAAARPLELPPTDLVGATNCPSAVVSSSVIIEDAPMREQKEQDEVSQSINEELTKVMKLLGGAPATKLEDNMIAKESKTSYMDISRDDSCYIGNVKELALFEGIASSVTRNASAPVADMVMPYPDDEGNLAGPAPTNGGNNDSLTILIDDESTMGDTEIDENNDPLKLMNNTLSDCIGILERARENHNSRTTASPSRSSPHPYAADVVAQECNVDEDDALSLMTEKLD